MVWLWLVVNVVGVCMAVCPSSGDIREREEIAGHPVAEVHFETGDGVEIAAWYVHAEGDRAVILLPGIDATRNNMTERAAYYRKRGFATLQPDFRGTGESAPALVTMGWNERHDLAAAEAFLRDRGYSEIGVHGVSMGAATICYGLQAEPDWAFVVLESCYDTIDNAFDNRLDMAGVPHVIALPMRVLTPIVMGVTSGELRPVAYLRRCTTPTLIMAGDAEPELRVAETEALFDQCGAPVKRMHLFEGGRHENFMRRYGDEYVDVVSDFLAMVEAGA